MSVGAVAGFCPHLGQRNKPLAKALSIAAFEAFAASFSKKVMAIQSQIPS
jgi:hypothetical protein